MTPERKAKEMLCKFGECAGTYLNETVFGISKRSAILCCDEIMAVLEKADEDRGRKEEFRPLAEYAFWDQVKQEIQEL